MRTKTMRVKKSAKDFASFTVKEVMKKQVQFAHLKTKGDMIASLLIEGFGAVPVVNGGRKLAGIVSEHDLLAAIDDEHELSRITAADIMTGNPGPAGNDARHPGACPPCQRPHPSASRGCQ